MPAVSLLKLASRCSGSMQTSSLAFETSTPQIVFFTVTCLVHAIGTQATVRSYVTWRRSQSSPTVVAGGVTGDIATRLGRWPPAKALSRFHRTKCSRADTRGLSPRIETPHPARLARHLLPQGEKGRARSIRAEHELAVALEIGAGAHVELAVVADEEQRALRHFLGALQQHSGIVGAHLVGERLAVLVVAVAHVRLQLPGRRCGGLRQSRCCQPRQGGRHQKRPHGKSC